MTGGASPRRRGDYFERQVRAELERRGYLVVRSGGSLGPADLLAVRRGHPPIAVSCKIGARLSRDERRTLAVTGERYGVHAMLCSRVKSGTIAWEVIYPSGCEHDELAAKSP